MCSLRYPARNAREPYCYLCVQMDMRRRTAAAERHSDVYEQTILYTNRHEGEALDPCSSDREHLCMLSRSPPRNDQNGTCL
jgi:hypothetical protein